MRRLSWCVSRCGTLLLAAVLVAGCVTGQQVDSWPTPRGGVEKIEAKFWPTEGTGRHPAVVLLHGCGGWHGGNIDLWARWFNERGYHAMAVESFASRGVVQGICRATSSPSSNKVDVNTRVHDAYGALATLSARPDVDPTRILIAGFSHGGYTGLLSLMDAYVPKGVPKDMRFRAGVLFYPGCTPIVGYAAAVAVPAQIIIGSEDDWTSADECVTTAKVNKPAGVLRTHVIEGAYHAFDQFSWKGKPVGSRSYLGFWLEPNMSAVREAEQKIEGFLRDQNLPADVQ